MKRNMKLLYCCAVILYVIVCINAQYACMRGADPCAPDYPCPIGARIPHPDSCSAYYQCVAQYQWAFNNYTCKQLYAAEICDCDYGGRYTCYNFTKECVIPDPQPPPTTGIPLAEPCVPDTNLTCVENGTVPDKYVCSRYHICVNQQWENRTCPESNPYYSNHFKKCGTNYLDGCDDNPCQYPEETTLPELTTEMIITTETIESTRQAETTIQDTTTLTNVYTGTAPTSNINTAPSGQTGGDNPTVSTISGITTITRSTTGTTSGPDPVIPTESSGLSKEEIILISTLCTIIPLLLIIITIIYCCCKKDNDEDKLSMLSSGPFVIIDDDNMTAILEFDSDTYSVIRDINPEPLDSEIIIDPDGDSGINDDSPRDNVDSEAPPTDEPVTVDTPEETKEPVVEITQETNDNDDGIEAMEENDDVPSLPDIGKNPPKLDAYPKRGLFRPGSAYGGADSSIIHNPIYLDSLKYGPRPAKYGVVDI